MLLREKRAGEARSMKPIAQEVETQEASAVNLHQSAPPSRLQYAFDVVLPALEARVRHAMPVGSFRDYYLWGLNPANPYHEAWIGMTGLHQIVEFTLDSVGFPFSDAQFPTFMHYAAPMISYLNFEVVSDNLEFGLNDSASDDATYYLRAHLIREFTRVMCQRLNGDETSAGVLLAPEEMMARRISTYLQSISPKKQRSIAEAFLLQHPGVSPDSLENGLLPLLIMNIETAADLVHITQQHVTRDLIRKGLYRRYRSAEHLFSNSNLDLAQVVSHGAYTILLIPVMAYYIEMSAHALGIPHRLEHAVMNGDLHRALYQCAILVRLLNDLGTPLVMMTDEQRRDLVLHLRRHARASRVSNIRAFLRREIKQTDLRSLLTRIAKDVETGEFNIALYNLSHINPLEQAVLTFGERLGRLSRIYHQTDIALERQLQGLTETLGSDAISRMIRRAVDFHYEMYNRDYLAVNGDFAV